MQNANTLFAVMRTCGEKGQTVKRLYRMLFNRELYLQAYAKLYSNEGAMTPGVTPETADEMSLKKIDNIIESVKFERYRWTPVRRTYIKKANGKLRPLGLPTWSDKLLQEVIRSILEAYYEPQFSPHSHGFRPNKGCHTALMEVHKTWTGTKWIIEGDISSYFDSIDHKILLEILKEKIDDNRFIRLIQGLLESGYMEDWIHNKTYSGTPQGGVLSPLLANIYLDKLDKYVEELIQTYNKGTKRAPNREYEKLFRKRRYAVKMGNHGIAKSILQQMRTMPSQDTRDPNYRRMRYVRYADDFMIGIIGPRSEAMEIKQKIGGFLQEKLKLKLSEEKTLVTDASQTAAKFLNYEIQGQYSNTKLSPMSGRHTRRSTNGIISLRVPKSVYTKKSLPYLQNGKPIHVSYMTVNSDYTIVNEYQSKLRGLYQYYALAVNVSKELSHLKYMMEQSLLKTLAAKHKTSAKVMRDKYTAKTPTDKGTLLNCIEVKIERDGKKPLVARFGGFSIERQNIWKIKDQLPKPINNGRTELLQRLLADQCEICGSTELVEVHHVRKLADIKGTKNEHVDWKIWMASRQRKTLVVCRKCHQTIHAGKPLPALANR
jgi:group II intron reverse transcriptase/maturase